MRLGRRGPTESSGESASRSVYFFCSTTMPLGAFPSMGNGDPAIADRPPLEVILKTEISLEALHTYTDCPEGSTTMPVAPLMVPLPPLGKGDR